VPAATVPELSQLAFGGAWRKYQLLALDAFDQDRKHKRLRTHIVAPPGSGKTLLGVEMVRRLGHRALVLVPNTAVQEQWLRAAAAFGAPAGLAAADPSAPLACLTYQALCQLTDPGAALGELAQRRWAADRAQATGTSAEEAGRDAASWTGAAAARRQREVAHITATLKREIARTDHGNLHLSDLLSSGARQRIETLRRGGIGTVVLDECHHLASLWGYLVRAAIAELGAVHLVALTATPPDALTEEETALYSTLLGPVDFTVPTPALVRDRALAPYQELAWLTRPLDSEAAWLAEHDLRFTELITSLHADSPGIVTLPDWVIARIRDRSREGEEAAVSWAGFQRAHRALARASARFLASGGLQLPPGVPRGEGYREPPDLADWLVLLEDYALRCLAADSGDAAATRYQQVAAGLRALGYTLTRQGIRRGASDVDRLLMNSAAKSAALADVVGCEFDARGDRLRALVLTDTEMASGAAPALADVLPADAGSAPAALRALAADVRTAVLRPLMVTGRGLRCAAPDADALLTALAQAAGAHCAGTDTASATGTAGTQAAGIDTASATGTAETQAAGADTASATGTAETQAAGTDTASATGTAETQAAGTGGAAEVAARLRAEPGEDGLVRLTAASAAWQPRLWVELATEVFATGATRLLVGTRALLGEGWDAPCVNCLVDLSSAATAMSVVQSRGRALRLDPSDPEKIASNWDVVCVAPELTRGTADYDRFVRKHLHLFAPSEDGAIEAGPSHVHPALGPFAPPPGSSFDEINREMTRRSAGHEQARDRWGIGQPYTGTEQQTLVILPRRQRRARQIATQPPRYRLSQKGPLVLAGLVAALVLVITVATGRPLVLAGLAAALALLGWAAWRLAGVRRVLADALPLDLVAHAICDAYHDLGELSGQAAGSLAIEPRASGYLRCFLPAATAAESARFTSALDGALSPTDFPRYLISRLVPTRGGGLAPLARVLSRQPPFDHRWVAVPEDLGRSKKRADAYARAWQRWLGPGELQFTQRTPEGREAAATASAQAADYQTSSRRIWV
jgi:superfamily II DNA or RNA helicase